MKCESCGGKYRTKELACPYCGRENTVGMQWEIQRNDAQKKYMRAKKKTDKKIADYSLDRIMTMVCIALFVCVLLCFGGIVFYHDFIDIRNNIKRNEYEAVMQEYYDNEEYSELYNFMKDKEIDFQDYYIYAQAVMLHSRYRNYITEKCIFMEMSDEDKAKDDFHIQWALDKSHEVYCIDLGMYSELAEENKAMYEEYQNEILSFWIGSLELTEEEIAKLISIEYLTDEDKDFYTQKTRSNYEKEK